MTPKITSSPPARQNFKRRCYDIDEEEAGEDILIIAIDGACSNNGQDNAKMSIGVLWSRHNYARHYNIADTVKYSRQTSQIAELIACKYARWVVNQAYEVFKPRPLYGPLKRVILKSDSAYLVRGVTEWMPKWTSNGYIDSQGDPVVNEDLWKESEEGIKILETGGLSVLFWQVPREQNAEADAMAKWALEFPINKDYSRKPVLRKIEDGLYANERAAEDLYDIWGTPSPGLGEWPPTPLRYLEILKDEAKQKKSKNKRRRKK